MVIRLKSNVAIVLILSPCNSTSNVVTFLQSSNKFNCELSSIYCQYLSNISASQVEEYSGFLVLNDMKRFMSGWSVNVVYPLMVTTDASPLRARVI